VDPVWAHGKRLLASLTKHNIVEHRDGEDPPEVDLRLVVAKAKGVDTRAATAVHYQALRRATGAKGV
jgi:hypothetical protein